MAESKKQGDKVLIFSRSIPTIEFIRHVLVEKRQYKLMVLTGATPQSQRQRMIDDFNDAGCGIDVFLISTIAGGIGVNLTAANRVVLVDQGWNP
ncbi:DNA excision repair protein ERCC-6, partial [Physocladia obscura]